MSAVRRNGPKSARPNPQITHSAQPVTTLPVTTFFCKNCRAYRTPTGIRFDDSGIDFTCKNCKRRTKVQF